MHQKCKFLFDFGAPSLINVHFEGRIEGFKPFFNDFAAPSLINVDFEQGFGAVLAQDVQH